VYRNSRQGASVERIRRLHAAPFTPSDAPLFLREAWATVLHVMCAGATELFVGLCLTFGFLPRVIVATACVFITL